MSDDPNDTAEEPGRLRRMYEEEAQARADATARVAELERREAFRDAGLDLNNPLHRDVAEAYKGELEAEKVKEHVASRGLTLQQDTPAPPPPPETPQHEREALERIAQAGAGDGTPPVAPDRVESLKRELEAAYAAKKPQAELNRILSEIAVAGGNQLVQH